MQRLKKDLRTAWIHPRPSGSTAPSHCGRYRSIPHGVLSALLPVRRSTYSLKLICPSPDFAVLNHPRSRLPQFVPRPVPGTSSRPDKSPSTARHPVGICQTPVLREPFTCTHKTWVWRCLTRSTPRLEAIAFDAVASTRTRGFTTFAIVCRHGHRADLPTCCQGRPRQWSTDLPRRGVAGLRRQLSGASSGIRHVRPRCYAHSDDELEKRGLCASKCCRKCRKEV